MFRTIVVLAICASASFAQPAATRVLRFNHVVEPQSLMEVGTVVRSTGEIRDSKADAQARTLTLSGEVWQMELAEWLMNKLDRVPVPARSGPERYEIPGIPDPSVRIFYPARADTPVNLQELTTTVRSVIEIRRAFTFNAAKAVVLRGTPAETDTAEWLFRELDRGPANGAVSEIRTLPNDSEGVIRVFYLRPVLSVEQFQRNATEVRREVAIRRMFTFNALRAMAIRGTAEQVAAAERLLEERQLLRN
jgi:hypothetical protein